MSVVTFWSDGKEQTGKTLSIAAISTYMAIEHNMRILVISTSPDDSTLRNCYIEKEEKMREGMYAPRSGSVAMQNGMDGLIKIAKSNKITPEIIRNYTRVIFKDALEILFSGNTNQENIEEYYPGIIAAASKYYDMVLVDLDAKMDEEIKNQIIEKSNLIVACIGQKLAAVDRFKEERQEDKVLSSLKTIVLLGRYDRFSKYKSANIARYLGLRQNQVLTIPYNSILFDAAEEAEVPDFFLGFVKNRKLDREDRNYLFIQEINRAVESIQYQLQALQMRM